MKIASIVEGDGEVVSLPLLLRRLAEWRAAQTYIEVSMPIRVRRDRFLNREQEFHRHLKLAAAKCGEGGWVLVLLDADDDCPAALGAEILRRAKACISHRTISVVIANREYEAWFIAASESLNGYRGFSASGLGNVDPEAPRDAKGWVRARMASRSYGEATDQAAFTSRMDLQQVFERSRSFRKLCKEWDDYVGA